jgi:uncharacterized protein
LNTTAPQPRIRIRRILSTVAITAVALLLGLPFLLGYVFLFAITHTPCSGDINPAQYGMPYEDVSFPSSEFEGDYAAYFIPGESDRTMIVVPTLGSGRGDRMSEIKVYHTLGYSVLTYSARVCFGVTHSLGYSEVTAVGDALAYLRSRSDVDSRQIALHGFSAGGATVLMALARYPEIRTAIAHGGYEDFDILLELEARNLGTLAPLFTTGARLAYRLATGLDLSVLKPIDGVRDSAPRPILLVYGSREVSMSAAVAMQEIAPERVELWVIPNADHGDYVAVAGEQAYGERIGGFLERVFSDAAPAP